MKPFISVLIRSRNRLNSLFEIISILLEQTYPKYEIVILDQSDSNHWESLDFANAKLLDDKKITLIKSKPLGPAGARNMGVVYCKGDVVLFMDDDDLPLGNQWIEAHAVNYEDPHCIGVSGRDVFSIGETKRYRDMSKAYERCLTYSFFLKGRVFTGIEKPKKPVQWLHGSNASVRKEYIIKAGGWYPFLNDFEEHSFCFKIRKYMSSKDYFSFNPLAITLRRFTIEGGIGRRQFSFNEILSEKFKYYHWVVSKYFPFRFYLLYPFFIIYAIRYSIKSYRKNSAYKKSNKNDKYFYHVLLSPLIALKYLVMPTPPDNGPLSLNYFMNNIK